MKLLYPDFLWALLALLIPIIIHLFNFRKFQRVYFSNIELLKEVKLETKSKSRLKHYIVLALRMLAITALVLAFCQPYMPTNDADVMGDNVVSIYIDNSHSMDSKGENGYRLDLAKEQASTIVSSYGPTDKFQLLTNSFEGRHQRLYNKNEVEQLIDDIEPSYVTRNISEVYLRQSDLIEDVDANKKAYWLSDFQKNAIDFEELKPDSTISIVCIPYEHTTTSNLYIDSIWFATPVRRSGVEDVVFAKVENTSNNSLEFKLNLIVNDENQGFVNFTIEPKSSIVCNVSYTLHSNGVQHAELKLTDYPDADLAFDDSYNFSYNVKSTLKVLHIYEGGLKSDSSGYLGTLYGRNEIFKFKNTTLGKVDFSNLKEFDFIALSNVKNISSGLNSELTNYINQGGSVCIFPASEINQATYNTFFQGLGGLSIQPAKSGTIKVNAINASHPLYADIFNTLPKNVDLPLVNKYYPIDYTVSSNTEQLMTLQNGKPLITYTKLPQGSISISAVPLDAEASNFPKHALFVPTMLRLAEFSNNTSKYSYIVGVDDAVKSTFSIENQEGLKIKKINTAENGGGDFEFIPEVSKSNSGTYLLLFNQISQAGHYDVVYNDTKVAGISFNYNRTESSQEFFSAKELEKELQKTGLSTFADVIAGADSENMLDINQITKGEKYWWQLIVLALIFLALEVLALRLFP